MKRAFFSLILAGFAGFLPAPAISAAKADTPALSERHKRWLGEEVDYIITDNERTAFNKLADDATRDLFIRAFWEARDPTPGTPRNEFQVEHYKRIAESNRLFGNSQKRPGSRTPRGRMYILLGAPKDRTNYPMEAKLYPIEDWFYQGDSAQGLPTFFHVLFYRPNGIGEYELYNPVGDGPEKLVGGSLGAYVDRFEALRALSNVSIELGVVSLSLIPSDPIDIDGGHAAPSSGVLVEKLRDLANHRPVDTGYVERVLGGKGRVEVDYSFKSLGLRSHFIGAFDHSGSPVLHYSVEIPPQSLTLERYGDRVSGALQVVGRIFTADGTTPVADVDEKIEIDLTLSEFESVKSSPFAFQDVFPLLPGAYQANLIVRNLVAREFGTVEGKFVIPDAAAEKGLTISPLLIAGRFAPAAEDSGKPFVFGDRLWRPAPGQRVASKGELLAVFQVIYPPAAHALGDTLSVRYALRSGSEDRLAGFGKIALNPVFDKGVAVGTVRAGVDKIPTGDYQLEVSVRGLPGEVASGSVPVQIRFDAPDELPWVYSRTKPRSSGETAFSLASQAAARGDIAQALRRYEVLAADTGVGNWALQARERAAEIRIRRREFAEALAVIEPLTTQEGYSGQAWVLLAIAQSGLGRHPESVRAYERALVDAPRNTRILNAFAEELVKTGDSRRAIDALQRSIVLDGDQVQVRELLTSLESAAVPVAAPAAAPDATPVP